MGTKENVTLVDVLERAYDYETDEYNYELSQKVADSLYERRAIQRQREKSRRTIKNNILMFIYAVISLLIAWGLCISAVGIGDIINQLL